MTTPRRSNARPISGMPHGTVQDIVMRSVVATMNTTVHTLSRTADTRAFDSPATAEHVHRLSQRIAGVTLDALRTWPEAER